MSENVIEQAADELARVMTSPRSYCVLLAEAIAQAGLLRPEIDDAMIERARAVLSDEGFLPRNINGEEHYPGYYNAVVRSALEAALGGEQ